MLSLLLLLVWSTDAATEHGKENVWSLTHQSADHACWSKAEQETLDTTTPVKVLAGAWESQTVANTAFKMFITEKLGIPTEWYPMDPGLQLDYDGCLVHPNIGVMKDGATPANKIPGSDVAGSDERKKGCETHFKVGGTANGAKMTVDYYSAYYDAFDVDYPNTMYTWIAEEKADVQMEQWHAGFVAQRKEWEEASVIAKKGEDGSLLPHHHKIFHDPSDSDHGSWCKDHPGVNDKKHDCATTGLFNRVVDLGGGGTRGILYWAVPRYAHDRYPDLTKSAQSFVDTVSIPEVKDYFIDGLADANILGCHCIRACGKELTDQLELDNYVGMANPAVPCTTSHKVQVWSSTPSWQMNRQGDAYPASQKTSSGNIGLDNHLEHVYRSSEKHLGDFAVSLFKDRIPFIVAFYEPMSYNLLLDLVPIPMNLHGNWYTGKEPFEQSGNPLIKMVAPGLEKKNPKAFEAAKKWQLSTADVDDILLMAGQSNNFAFATCKYFKRVEKTTLCTYYESSHPDYCGKQDDDQKSGTTIIAVLAVLGAVACCGLCFIIYRERQGKAVFQPLAGVDSLGNTIQEPAAGAPSV